MTSNAWPGRRFPECTLIHVWLFNNSRPLFFRNAWYEDGRLLLILITLCVVLPLSILPKIGKRVAREASTFAGLTHFSPDLSLNLAGFLGYTSSVAFLFVLYFVVVVSFNIHLQSFFLLSLFLFLTCSVFCSRLWSRSGPFPAHCLTMWPRFQKPSR